MSVIEYNRKNWQTYKEWQTNRNGTSWKQELKDIIDKNIAIAKSYDEFVLKMRQENIL